MEDALYLMKQCQEELLEEEKPEKRKPPRKRRRVKRKPKAKDPAEEENFDIEGVVRVVLSLQTQRQLACTLGEHVTLESPWVYVPKELFKDEMLLDEFEMYKEEIINFPLDDFLLGYIADDERPYDEFYMCITEEATTNVEIIIKRIEDKRAENLKKLLVRTPQKWKTYGSHKEIKLQMCKINRPLLMMEVESNYPISQKSHEFKLRLAQDAKDGYTEFLSTRNTFNYIVKRKIDCSCQATPQMRINSTQTRFPYPKNAYSQYEYNPVLPPMNDKETVRLNRFATDAADSLESSIDTNSFIELYSRDYENLAQDFLFSGNASTVKPFLSFLETGKCRGKQISTIAFHHMWTGVFAVAYAQYAIAIPTKGLPEIDEVLSAIYNTLPVLIWSFKDNLNPRLILETPRDVQQISFCPYDENILVGGCVNGQVVIWDISNKLQGVEEEEILTEDQRRYRMLMNSMMGWMKNVKDLKVVRPCVVSSLEYSHSRNISSIKWISSYREISSSGELSEIPESENRTSLQFATSSRDGTVFIWDLLAKPSLAGTNVKPRRRLKRLKKIPAALVKDESPLKVFNRIFKPTFKVLLLAPNTNRLLPIMSMNFPTTRPLYEEKYPDPNRKFNIYDRIYFKCIHVRPSFPMVNQFAAGSIEGDFLCASWEGFSFNPGEFINKDTCKYQNFAKYHDGPVVCLCRSELFQNLILTVGGSVFALWRTDFIGRPCFWRRSRVKYTHGIFNTYRPSVFRLSKSDGNVELWHLPTRSDRYVNKLRFSNVPITGSFTHPRPMQQQVVASVDAKGMLIMHFVAAKQILNSPKDRYSTYNFTQREIDRKLSIEKWQNEWLEKHPEAVVNRQADTEDVPAEAEVETVVPKKEVDLEEKLGNPELYAKRMHEEMVAREMERVKRIVLSKKRLDMDVLNKQQIPLLKRQKEALQLKEKQNNRKKHVNDIFKSNVAMLFPEALHESPSALPDPYAGGDPVDEKANHFQNYAAIEEALDKFIKRHSHNYIFDWVEMLKAGKTRREFISYGPKRRIRPFHKPEDVVAITEEVKEPSVELVGLV